MISNEVMPLYMNIIYFKPKNMVSFGLSQIIVFPVHQLSGIHPHNEAKKGCILRS